MKNVFYKSFPYCGSTYFEAWLNMLVVDLIYARFNWVKFKKNIKECSRELVIWGVISNLNVWIMIENGHDLKRDKKMRSNYRALTIEALQF